MMKKTWIMLLVVAMVGALLAVPGTALAKGKPGPTVGETCAEFYAGDTKTETGSWRIAAEEQYTIHLSKEVPAACYDFTSGAETDWTVTVAGGDARYMFMGVRDSAPGDWCGTPGYESRDGNAITRSLWQFLAIPASGLDACGTGFADADEALTFWVSASRVRGDLTVTIDVTAATSN